MYGRKKTTAAIQMSSPLEKSENIETAIKRIRRLGSPSGSC
jgi:hypothetical protein